jgi:hypothetical protein
MNQVRKAIDRSWRKVEFQEDGPMALFHMQQFTSWQIMCAVTDIHVQDLIQRCGYKRLWQVGRIGP